MIDPFAKLTGAQATATPTFKTADFGLQRRIEFAAVLRQSEAAVATPPSSSANTSALLTASDAASPALAVQGHANNSASLNLPPRARGGPPTPPASPNLPPRTRGGTPTPPTPPAPPNPVEALGFVPSDALDGPVRYLDVPDFAKAPIGLYVQAPAEYGGEWWQVNPFNWEPWRILDAPPPDAEPTPLPEGFEQLFGPRPLVEDFGRNYWTHQVALIDWEQSLKYFKGVGMPEGFDAVRLEEVTADFREWGLGEPVFYEGNNGWRARFPDSQNPSYETKPHTLLIAPHVNIAAYQISLLKKGITPATIHPFIPPRAFEIFGIGAAV